MTKPFAYDLGTTNFDIMDPDELAEFATHLQVLLLYVSTRRLAMVLRLDGRTADALKLEEQTDGYYRALPSNWQW
jgi:hypothetical protein